MIRVWALFFVLAFSVAFLIHRPEGFVYIPHSEEFPKVPADVFWYHLDEHFISIITALLMLSFFKWPAEREFYPAFALFFVIQIVDVILFRLFYRNWPIDVIPYNAFKVLCFGILTLALQIQTTWNKMRLK